MLIQYGITYCSNIDCNNMKCARNQLHLKKVKDTDVLYISVSPFPECKYWGKGGDN